MKNGRERTTPGSPREAQDVRPVAERGETPAGRRTEARDGHGAPRSRFLNFAFDVRNRPRIVRPKKIRCQNPDWHRAMQIEALPVRCRVKDGWGGAGRTGIVHVVLHLDQDWAVILWDDDDGEPDLHKAAGLDFLEVLS